MKNVTRETIKKNNKEVVKMSKAEQMSNAINEFILDNDFLRRFIIDNVKDKIYVERFYSDSMIESVLTTDLYDNNESYILSHILDEIDIYALIDKIDNLYRDDFMTLAEQCNQ